MVLSYRCLSVSFATSVLYLVQGGDGRRFAPLPSGKLLDEIATGPCWSASRCWPWHRARRLVGQLSLGALLGLGPEGDVGAGHLARLRRLPARPRRAGLARHRCAWLCVLGFAGMLFSYFVVNLWVSGLHSYAGV